MGSWSPLWKCQLFCPISSPSCSLANVHDLHFCSSGGQILAWTVDPSLQVGVVRSWMGRRKPGRVISLNLRTQGAFTDLQISCTEEDTWESWSPAVAFASGLLAAECAQRVLALSDGAARTAGPFGGMLLNRDLSSFRGFFCLWECCLPANPSLQGQAAFHYVFLTIETDV